MNAEREVVDDAIVVAHILRRVARHPSRKPSTRDALLRYADQITTTNPTHPSDTDESETR